MAKRKKTKKKIDAAVISRAKKVGLTDDRIALYPNTESLKTALDGMSPQTNPDARVKPGVIPEPKVYDKGMPDKFEIESKLETRLMSLNRNQFDENNLQAKLRWINRKYGVQMPVKIVKSMTFKPVNAKNEQNQNTKVLVTKFEIFLKG